MSKIDIADIDNAALLAALYNRAGSQGLGHIASHHVMSRDDAARLLYKSDPKYFDSLQGRVMKIDLSMESETIEPWHYDRDNGTGAVQGVVDRLRAEKGPG